MKLSPLVVTDYNTLKGFFDNQHYRLSSYSLLSLISWSNQKLQTYYTIENGQLIIGNKSINKPENNHLILPISPYKHDNSPEYLSTLAKRLGFTSYWFVPEDYFMEYNYESVKSFFNVTEQNEFNDYIYLTDDLALLKGNKFTKQRNLIHQFYKKYIEKDKVEIEIINRENAYECLHFLQEWCEIRQCDLEQNESLACEKMATIKVLNNIDTLEVNGLLVRINDTVSAFGIVSRLTDFMGILNFEKAYPHIKGLYQFLDNECAKRLFAGYTYINKESDMNLANLAQSKKSYNPVMMIKSYCLTVI
jgi:uncharacterized protein